MEFNREGVMELSRSIYVHGKGAVGPWDPWPQKREGKKGKGRKMGAGLKKQTNKQTKTEERQRSII